MTVNGDGYSESQPEPTPIRPGRPVPLKMTQFDPQMFLDSKLLWATNYFVLWPLGLTLAVEVDDALDGERAVSNLHVREWAYPNGEMIETINQDQSENQSDFRVFLAFVRDRLLAMKPDERHSALAALSRHGIAESEQILSVEP